jgi:CheY-like chemotaxis protein
MFFHSLDLAVRGGSDIGITEGLVAADSFQRREKVFRVRRLYNISQSTCTERLRGHLRRFVLAQDDCLGLRKYAANFPSGLKAIQIRHAEIHEHEIWQQHFCLLYRIATVYGLAANVEVSLRQQERPHTSSHYFVVIHYENSQSFPRSTVENPSLALYFPARWRAAWAIYAACKDATPRRTEGPKLTFVAMTTYTAFMVCRSRNGIGPPPCAHPCSPSFSTVSLVFPASCQGCRVVANLAAMDLRILIVDDSLSMRRIIATILRSHSGWAICGEAENGLSGIEMFQELNPDLVLLDFGMPDINGIEAASRMSTANPTVPLILFTIWDIEGFEREAAKAGICAVVRKSEAWKLIAKIETVFAQKSKQTIQ